MAALTVKAYAKINLTLEALGKRADGYHSIVSVMQTIDLSGNLLPSLPAGLFSGRSSLQEIDLSRNTIATLPSRVFAGLPALRSVDVSQSRLAAPFAVLPGGAFEGVASRLAVLEGHVGERSGTLLAGLAAA